MSKDRDDIEAFHRSLHSPLSCQTRTKNVPLCIHRSCRKCGLGRLDSTLLGHKARIVGVSMHALHCSASRTHDSCIVAPGACGCLQSFAVATSSRGYRGAWHLLAWHNILSYIYVILPSLPTPADSGPFLHRLDSTTTHLSHISYTLQLAVPPVCVCLAY